MKELCLGVELGSTRVKAVAVDKRHMLTSSGSYTWTSHCINGLWTYDLDEVWSALKAVIARIERRGDIAAVGVSAMMHGYLVFDKEWRLLTPFRTWQNTVTGEASEGLSALFNVNVPQRWSVAHLYQAILDGEEHVERIAHITTLAGYVHFMLTGINALGVGDASGVFPLEKDGLSYHKRMLDEFDGLIAERGYRWKIRDILPDVLVAGELAGQLNEYGSELLGGLLPPGIPFAPCEGDAGTGMAATNSVAPCTGNVSAGTSIFSMVVLEQPMRHFHPEIDMVSTPTGRPVAMVHCNNCSGDLNDWVVLLMETVGLFGTDVSQEKMFERLFNKSLEGSPDCGGLLVYNNLTGESLTGLTEGVPLVMRGANSLLTIANFVRAQLYSAFAALKIGVSILEAEGVRINGLTAHGGLFKTPGVAQRYLASALGVPVTCMDTAGEGGAYGMALLVAYMLNRHAQETLETYLADKVFTSENSSTIFPEAADADGFCAFLDRYRRCFAVERAAIHGYGQGGCIE